MKIKEWYAKKLFAEKGSKFYADDVMFIFGETEKAYHAIVGCYTKHLVTWVPKSLCIPEESDNTYWGTQFCKDYNEAIWWFKYHMAND